MLPLNEPPLDFHFEMLALRLLAQLPATAGVPQTPAGDVASPAPAVPSTVDDEAEAPPTAPVEVTTATGTVTGGPRPSLPRHVCRRWTSPYLQTLVLPASVESSFVATAAIGFPVPSSPVATATAATAPLSSPPVAFVIVSMV